jgi:predicted dehydrogenase
MGNRHLRGLAEYARVVQCLPGYPAFRVIAVCDPNDRNANLLADSAEAAFGSRPTPFANVDALLEAFPNLDAVDITTEPRLHASIATRFLHEGVHVLVEKPMALTVSQCNAMDRAAKRAGRILCVAENYRFDPLVRLTRALLDVGAIGKPTLLLDHSVGSGGRIVITPWRHKRLYGGTLLDVGVHNVDLMAYYLGRVKSVNARVALLDTVRVGLRSQGSTGAGVTESPGAIYAVTNANLAVADTVTPDVEDTALATLELTGGVLGHWTLSHAGHGAPFGHKAIYGALGSMEPAPPRTGHGPTIRIDGSATPLDVAGQLALVPDFSVDAATAHLFGGERLGAYHIEAIDIDRRIQAAVFADFGNAIATGRSPEVGADKGRHAVAVVNALFESSRLQRSVSVSEVEAEVPTVSGWQTDLDRDLMS